MDLHSKIQRRIKILVVVAVVLAIAYGVTLVKGFEMVAGRADDILVEPTTTQVEKIKSQPEALSEPIIIENTPKQPEPAKKSQESVILEEKAPEPVKEVQMERIPFTSKEVQPGKPESYVDTYGQCPFYENAGAKGCYPPADIQCNEDWSVCEYIGTRWDGK